MLPLLNSFGPGHLFFGFGGLFGRIAEFDIHLQRVDAGLALLGLIGPGCFFSGRFGQPADLFFQPGILGQLKLILPLFVGVPGAEIALLQLDIAFVDGT